MSHTREERREREAKDNELEREGKREEKLSLLCLVDLAGMLLPKIAEGKRAWLVRWKDRKKEYK